MNIKTFAKQTLTSGGATMSLNTEVPTTGFFAAFQQFEKVVDGIPSEDALIECIADYTKKNAEVLALHDTMIGSWVNEGKIYLDIVQHFTDREQAIAFGIQEKQLAIYDIDNQESITL